MAYDRFTNNTLAELQEANHSPIYGYQQLPILALEKATEKITSLVPDVQDYVSTAKQKCNKSSTLLTRDESAAIYLYSMHTPIFSRLNEALRTENRQTLKPWFAFLKLFITALEKLPSTKRTVWRGVRGNVCSIFADGDVHTWWSVNSCSKDITVVEVYLSGTSTLFAIEAIHGKDISKFSAFPVEKEIVLMPGTRVSATTLPLNLISRLFIIHLEEEDKQSESQTQPRYLFELVKQAYQQNSRIERIMNPSKSFPIEQSYINLAIVESKEQQEKEKKLLNANHSNEIIGTYEEIYGMKTKIEIQNIFEKCKDQTKKILVLGRAGIGKTTFCRYVAYQWTTGAIWQEYELVILIHLRNLTESRYPPLALGAKYSLIDLVKTEYFYDGLSEEYERILKEELNKSQVLWLLDGYDEIIQNIPEYLQYLLDQLLNKPHHILTSRPYLNTLSYNVQMEIIGFTDDNIEEYVKQFFDHIKDKIDNAPLQAEKLLNFLTFNPRIWGIVHIPVNLELICSLWCDTDPLETTTLTVTTVYDKIIEWLCRRHLTKQNISSSQMTREDVYTHLHTELAFLEALAFNGMESKSIILPPKLLRIASRESACSLHHQSHLLNIGILKSLDYKPIGTCIEADKNHYFLHLSFQEHFAARYLVKALNGIPDQKEKAIEFIKNNKYNQRFELVLMFASGLLTECYDKQLINLFWDTLMREPIDLIGVRHRCIVISCLDEAECAKSIPQYRKSMDTIIKWISYFLSEKHNRFDNHILVALKRCPSLVNQPEILDTLFKLYEDSDSSIKMIVAHFIFDLPISNLCLPLFQLLIRALDDQNNAIKIAACEALWKMGEKAATGEVINGLIALLDDRNDEVRRSASEALGRIGATVATDKVIIRILDLLDDANCNVKSIACNVLGKMGEKAANNEVINRLITLLNDRNHDIRRSASEALGRIGATVATDKMIIRILDLLDDANCDVRSIACTVLGKMGEKAANNEVIDRLSSLLSDTDFFVRHSVSQALGKMDGKTGTNKVVKRLLILLGDTNDRIRRNVCKTLMRMGEKAATNEVINRLIALLDDRSDEVRKVSLEALVRIGTKTTTNKVVDRLLVLLDDAVPDVRSIACYALVKMGEKAATNEAIDRLLVLLKDENCDCRSSASGALGKMGEKAATSEVINELITLLDDRNDEVRRSASEALGRMGTTAATDKMIIRLSVLLDDTNEWVRRSASEALGKVGEKAATGEVINGLIALLDDRNDEVRRSASEALGRMGTTAATDKVINRLLDLLDDENDDIRRIAYEALWKIGEKTITDEVVNRLLILLDNADYEVRRNTSEVLGRLGEKAATNEVINRLLALLADAHFSVRRSAREALENMGEKAATNEVINRLLILFGDTNDKIRIIACHALAEVGEEAATTEVIDRLVALLDDSNPRIRSNACETLRKMGGKATTNEVINKLLVLVYDADDDVERSACKALRAVSKKGVPFEVISRLLALPLNTNDRIIRNACEALIEVGEKAATNEVINRLVSLLGDANREVRSCVCKALAKMGDKAATNEVIEGILDVYMRNNGGDDSGEKSLMARILNLLPCMSALEAATVHKLAKYISGNEDRETIEVSPEKMMRAFLNTKIKYWLPIILKVFVRRGFGITVTETTVTVHNSEGPVELTFSDRKIGIELRQYFDNWFDNPLKKCERLAEETISVKDEDNSCE